VSTVPAPAPDLTELDAMLDATLAELGRRAASDADGGEVSFGVGDGVGGLVRVGRDAVSRIEGLLAVFVDACEVETGEGPTRMRTRVGWRGDTTSELPPGVTATQVATHVAATAAALEERARRLHALAMVLGAAGRIAGMMAVPGGAVMALPLAYEHVRDIHRRWNQDQDQGTRRTP
jgi:hypothetical protein